MPRTQRGEVQQAQQDMQEQFRQQLENKFLEVRVSGLNLT